MLSRRYEAFIVLVVGVACVVASQAWGGPLRWRVPPAGAEAYREALAAWRKNDGARAREAFLRAAEAAPDWPWPHAWLGILYQWNGEATLAREEYAAVQRASFGVGSSLSAEEAERRALLSTGEAYLVYLINMLRQSESLRPLLPDADLARLARQHSEEMRDKGYFAHESPRRGQRTCQDRFFAYFGYRPPLIAENIARRWGTHCSPTETHLRATHLELLASTGHRRNMLLPRVRLVGVGLAMNAQGDYWLTELFVEPREEDAAALNGASERASR